MRPDLGEEAPEIPSYRPVTTVRRARRQVAKRRRLTLGAALLGACLLSAIAGLPLVAGAGTDLVKINTSHLDALLVPLPGGKSVWAAAWYPSGSPSRKHGGPQADPETGLLSRTEDIARIASFYLDAAAPTGFSGPDAAAADLRRARQALEWLLDLQTPDGRFAYGVDHAGKPSGPVDFEWPGARAFWALAQGARLLPKTDPLRSRALAGAERTLGQIRRAMASGGLERRQAGSGSAPGLGGSGLGAGQAGSGPAPGSSGGLINGSAAETGAVVLGLLDLDQAAGGPGTGSASGSRIRLIADLTGAIAARRGGDPGTYPYQAHMPTANPTLWHAYGAYQVAALASAGQALGNRAWITEAELEAASWTVHLLISGGPIWGLAPAPRPFPQIPYNLEPQVRGLLALHNATGKDSYGRLAGLLSAWLLGDNAAGKPLYESATGRVHDGLDPGGPAIGAGAEATALGLSVLRQLNRHPEFLRYVDARETGARRAVAARSTTAARTVAGSGPYAGSSFVLMPAGKRVEFTPGVEGPMLVAPMFVRGMADPSAAGALELRFGGWSQRFAADGPADPAIGPVLEVGHATEPIEMRGGDRIGVGLLRGSTLPVALDGVLCQPVVEYRSWNLPKGKVAVVKSLSNQWLPLQYAWPGASVTAYSPTGKQVRAGEDLEPFGYALIESGR